MSNTLLNDTQILPPSKPEDWHVSELDLIASITRESFYEFVKEFWHVVVPERPVFNWHIEYICNEMQAVAERVFLGLPKEYDLVINVPPGSTKSTLASVLFTPWTWTRMPSARTIGTSYAYPLAMDLSRKSRDVVLVDDYHDADGNRRPGYPRVFPEIELRTDQNTKGLWANTRGGTRYAVGTGGSVTGMHSHFIIIDDPLNPKMAASEADLEMTNTFLTETLPSRKVDKTVSVQILIQQRLHQSDPSGVWVERGNEIRHICLPADDTWEIKPGHLKSNYVDGLLDPIRLPRKVLDEEELTMGQYGYAGQYGQSPIPRGGGMFKTDRIKEDVPPPLRAFKKLVRFWDKAATAGGGAYSVGVLMGEDKQGRFWVLNVERHQLDSFEREELIKNIANRDGKQVIVGIEEEGGSGGKESAQGTMRRLRGYRVRSVRPQGDKVVRADEFSTQVNAGNVYVPKGSRWLNDYLEELKYFPKGTYKDQVDASSGAFTLLNERGRKFGAL